MHYLYMLQRKSNSRETYIGYTNDLKRRLLEHNKHTSTKRSFTQERGDWKLVYYEAYSAKEDCVEREKSLKQHGSSVGHLKKRIRFSLSIEN